MLATRNAIAPPLMLLLVLLGITLATTPASGKLDECLSEANPVGFPVSLAVCPAGDGETLADKGARIDLILRDATGHTVQRVPKSDIWIIGCNQRYLCYLHPASTADDWTDANGETSISGTITGGGMDTGVNVYIQGVAIQSKPDCLEDDCMPMQFRSVDINDDNIVDVIDFSVFGASYPPGAYNPAADFNFDGVVGLQDLAYFSAHFGHECP